jgi:hypothetical protein
MSQHEQKDLKPLQPKWWEVSRIGLATAMLFIGAYATIYLLDIVFSWGVPSENVVVIMAALVAAALPIGFVWNRLTKFKVWEVEVELADVAVQPVELSILNSVQAIHMGSSYYDIIIQQIQQALTEGQKARVMTLNLSSGPPWWSTRLFLVAAMAQKFTEIQQIVFLENCSGPDDCYVGSATPEALRRRLANKQDFLEQAYKNSPDRENPVLIAHEFIEWFKSRPEPEKEQQTSMTKQTLREWLGEGLVKEYVDWQDGPSPHWMLRKIITYPLPFVPILQCGRLRLIVDQQDLEKQLASYVIQAQEKHSNTKK